MTYEIIGKLPLFRKRFGFYKNERNLDKLAFGFYLRKVDGFKVGLCRTASSKEEAMRIAGEMLVSEHGFESVSVQDPQDPESGAIQLSIEKKANT